MENKKLTRVVVWVGMRIIFQNLLKNFGMSSWPVRKFACVGKGCATNRLDETKEFWSLLLSKVMPCSGEERKGGVRGISSVKSFKKTRATSSRQQGTISSVEPRNAIPIAQTFLSLPRQGHTFSLMKKYQKNQGWDSLCYPECEEPKPS